MAHGMKVKGGINQVYGLCVIHNDRTGKDPEHEKEINRNNGNINPEKSKDNYNLIERNDLYEYAKKRYDEIEKDQEKAFRKDAVRAFSLVVYLPQEKEANGKEYEKEFFNGCLDYMKNKFGEKNILQAIVHKDENRPHIHIVAIPTTRDEHGKEHLNFKGAFQRQDYKEMHPELERHTQERTHDKTIRLYDETKEKTKTVSKERYILQDELKKLDKVREELERKEKELQKEIEKQKEQEKKLEAKEKELQEKEKELQKKIKEHNKQVKEYNQEREKLKNAERQQEERKNYLEERKNFCKENGIKDYKYHQAVKDYERTGDPTFNFFSDKDGKQYLGYIDPEIINPDRSRTERALLENQANNFYNDKEIQLIPQRNIERLETPEKEQERGLEELIKQAERDKNPER